VLSGAERQRLAGFDRFGVDDALRRLDDARFVDRMWRRDVDLWKPGDAAHAAVVRSRLGWLTVAEEMDEQRADIESFADGVRADGIRHVVLMGMGGSSLCPIVLAKTFGSRDGFPEPLVLDSTAPDAVAAIERRIDLRATLFVEASNSCTTLESRCFAEYFFAKASAALESDAAASSRFAAITDPGTPLEDLARKRAYRRVFANPPDIGGRYSALSFFGLVPGALAGVDIGALLAAARSMAKSCGGDVPASRNPAVALGVALALAARKAHRDKVTFFAASRIGTLGMWLEQLIAESTGKEGKGLIPIADEAPGAISSYGDDRVFISISCAGESPHEDLLDHLEAAGHPVVRIALDDAEELGGEFFRWEFATAVAGAQMGIDPFDEPNVKESKDNTNRILAAGVQNDTSAALPSAEGTIGEQIDRVLPNDYLAIQAFIAPGDARTATLEHARRLLRDATKAATTFGYGPRFLHSTGQLHKGGPNTGVFLQLVGRSGGDPPIPGQPFGFGTLIAAQAQGDLQSLRDHGRRVLSIDLGEDVDAGLAAFAQSVERIASAKMQR
jgi:glucose-6-phosphate isomerase